MRTPSEKLLEAIDNANEKCPGKVFYAFNGYFTLYEGGIDYLSDQYGDGPKGGGAIPIFTGLKDEDEEYLESLLEEYDINASVFSHKLNDSFPFTLPSEISADEYEDEVFQLWEDDEEHEPSEDEQKYFNLKKAVESGKTKYKTMDELLDNVYRLGLSPDTLYYPWEGGSVELQDTIAWSDEDALYVATEEKWIEVLNNIESYVVTL